RDAKITYEEYEEVNFAVVWTKSLNEKTDKEDEGRAVTMRRVFDCTNEYDATTGEVIGTMMKGKLIDKKTNKPRDPITEQIKDHHYKRIVWEQVYQYEKCTLKYLEHEIYRKKFNGKPVGQDLP